MGCTCGLHLDRVFYPSLAMYTVFSNPKDYPGKYVVRVFTVSPGGIVRALRPVSVTSTLEKARASLPAGLKVIPRRPEDDPSVVESWV